MKKAIRVIAVIAVLAAGVFGYVVWSSRTAASAAVDAYNAAAEEYNEKIAPYNAAADQTEAANQALQEVLDTAQALADKGAAAYEPKTLKKLEEAVSREKKRLVEVPVRIEPLELRALETSFDKRDLDRQRQEADAALAAAGEALEAVPQIPEVPDYTKGIESVEAAQKAYEDSVQKLANVTAPPDTFVRDRLLQIDTIEAAGAVTADNDPNGLLGKKGGYLGCVYFLDQGVDRDLLPQEAFAKEEEKSGEEAEEPGEEEEDPGEEEEDPGEEAEVPSERPETGSPDASEEAGTGTTAAETAAESPAKEAERSENRIDVVMIGTAGGGAVEIYATEEEAEARREYITFFQGSVMEAGAASVEGTCVIRTSRHLDSEQQEKLTEKIREALLKVD